MDKMDYYKEISLNQLRLRDIGNEDIDKRIMDHYQEIYRAFTTVKEMYENQGLEDGICKRVNYFLSYKIWANRVMPWFRPERFNIDSVWVSKAFSDLNLRDIPIIHTIKSLAYPNVEYSLVPVRDLNRIKDLGLISVDGAYWFPRGSTFNPHRVKVLELAIEDLIRIYDKYTK